MNLHELQILTEDYYKLTPNVLFKKCMKRELAWARFFLFKIAREELGFTLQSIGDFAGGKDHTTVMYGIKQIGNVFGELEKYDKYKDEILKDIIL